MNQPRIETFVGGPADGEHFLVDIEADYWDIFVPINMSGSRTRIETYSRVRISTPEGECSFFRPVNIPRDEAIKTLIAEYGKLKCGRPQPTLELMIPA